jgi:hypothetical protein
MSASADGTYSFVYCGAQGVGIGVITIKNNVLMGADLGGGRYRGLISEQQNGDGYRLVFDMFVPANVLLVQGASPQEISYTKSDIAFDIRSDFGNGEPIKLFVPPGELTLMIQRIPDDYAWYASGVKVTMTPE